MNIEEAKATYPIGTKVKYYPIFTERKQYREGVIRSEPWEVCGSVIVKITGRAGGVDVEHLEIFDER